jgi:Na+/phosphate symporter
MIGVGFLLSIVGKSKLQRNIGQVILSLGLVFWA